YRRGGKRLMWWTVVVSSVYLAAIASLSWDPWNPSVTILPFAAALTCAWALACGDWWALPVFVAIASFLVQTHIEYAVPIALSGVAAFGFAVVTAVSSRRRPLAHDQLRRLRRCLLTTAAVGVMLWLPVFVEQLIHDPVKLDKLFDFVTTAHPSHTLADGLDASVRSLGTIPSRLVDGWQLYGSASRSAANWSSIITIGAVVGATAVAIRTRDRHLVALLGIGGAAFGGAVL